MNQINLHMLIKMQQLFLNNSIRILQQKLLHIQHDKILI